MNSYYTYAYLREDKTPYYIGKGKNRRAHHNCGRYIQPPKDKNRILFLKKNLTEEEAFKHEKYMIAILGRKDLGTGILRNLTDGGEGSSGRVLSEESRKKMRNSAIGKIVSEKTKQKMSDSSKGKPKSEEHRKKISEAQRGEKNHRYGKPLSKENRKKLSELHKGKILSEEHRKKMSDSRRGKKFKKIHCPHCGKIGGGPNMNRYHFDNCSQLDPMNVSKDPTNLIYSGRSG
jgi:hypothetical protein